MFDIQKADIWRRISAFILDFICLVIICTGTMFVFSYFLKYDVHNGNLNSYYSAYENKYNIVFNITEEEYVNSSDEFKKKYDSAYEELISDPDVVKEYNMVISLSILIVSLSILVSFIIVDFVIPIVFGNGQTVGKKIFGIAVMRAEGYKINNICLFIRTLLGKYTIETMIPTLVIIMILFIQIGIIGIIILFLIILIQMIILIVTKNNSLIHDLLSDTVVVDYSSQMIFDSIDDVIEHKKKIAAENAEKSEF